MYRHIFSCPVEVTYLCYTFFFWIMYFCLHVDTPEVCVVQHLQTSRMIRAPRISKQCGMPPVHLDLCEPWFHFQLGSRWGIIDTRGEQSTLRENPSFACKCVLTQT